MPPRFAGVGLTKRFGPLVAVDGVSLTVAPGEIHCLLGENGAGKSTLSSCLYGLYRLDAGRMEVDGRPYAPRSPLDAVAAGLGMVHQHFVLVPTFTALENIVVGTGTGWRLDLAAARRRVSELCAGYGIALDLDRRVGELAVGERQWVEIIKALHLGARLLILDEPTAVLTPDESAHLFAILRQMTVAGLSVVLITHKMGEVMRTDRVSVLRKGRLVGSLRTAETSRDQLARMMMGRTP
jgi:general nucleoside transport system ATP-binding protein